jgi:hypothetical protein
MLCLALLFSSLRIMRSIVFNLEEILTLVISHSEVQGGVSAARARRLARGKA